MLKRTFWKTLPVNISQALTGFLAITVFTHLLTHAEYGHYAIAQGLMMVSYILLFKWLDSAMARFYAEAQSRNHLPDHFRTAYVTYAVWALGFAVLASVGISILPMSAEVHALALAAILAILVRAAVMIGIESHLAAGEYRAYVLVEGGGVWLSLGLGILFAKLGLGGSAPLAGLAAGFLVVLLFDLPGMLRRARGGVFVAARVRDYARFGAPMAWALGLTLLLTTTDRLFIAYYLGDAAVGPYAAGYNLAAKLIELCFLAIWLVAYPMAVRALENKDDAALDKTLRDYADLLLLTAVPAGVGLACVAPELSRLLVAPAFQPGVQQVMPLAALAMLLSGLLFYYMELAFSLARRTVLLMWINGAVLLAQCVGCVVLIPRMGVTGAIWATIAALIVGLVVSGIMGRRLLRLPYPLREFGLCVFCCTLMAAVVLSIPAAAPLPALILKVAAGVATFGLCAVAVNLGHVRGLARRVLIKPRMEPSL